MKYKQHKFFYTMWSKRSLHEDDPLVHVIKTVINANTITSRTVREFITTSVTDLNVAMEAVKDIILEIVPPLAD